MAAWLSSKYSLADILLLSILFSYSVQEVRATDPSTAVLRNSSFLSSIYLLESLKRWPTAWVMVSVCLACGLGSYTWKRREGQAKADKEIRQTGGTDIFEDPPLLKKHSTIKVYRTSRFEYTGIRTFHHPHPQAGNLPKDGGPLPLLVFVHGLGGSVAQFASLLSTLVNIGSCLGVDLPGCGLSDLSPKDWDAYSHEALVELLEVIIQQVCDVTETQTVVLIAHSMGCSLSVSLALSQIRQAEQSFNVAGIIAICPKVSPILPQQAKTFSRLLNIPSPIFNAWRFWDQRGGLDSASVTRFVGADASQDTRKLQLKFNQQSRTETFRRVARGALSLAPVQKGLPGPDEWAKLTVPLFAIAGENDVVTSPKEIELIIKALGREEKKSLKSTSNGDQTAAQSFSSGSTSVSISSNRVSKAVLKTTILPSPASHGLIYDLTTYRTLSGLIQDFMANHIDKRLSLGWQLQALKESNKWDVKNLAKWKAVTPVSDPIAGVFYALKTLREVDEVHSPKEFTKKWSTKIKAVVDISYESPVYNPCGLEEGGIAYHKNPTVSKVPPTVDEVRDFISLIDQLRSTGDSRLIGVHCHYGFNRTGFFICTYLIERLGYGVQAAIDEFQKGRPPGIRHEHFLDKLWVRYTPGLKRAPTL